MLAQIEAAERFLMAARVRLLTAGVCRDRGASQEMAKHLEHAAEARRRALALLGTGTPLADPQ